MMDDFDANAEQVMWFGDEPDPWEDPYAGEEECPCCGHFGACGCDDLDVPLSRSVRGRTDDYFEQDMSADIFGWDSHLDDIWD